MLNSNNVGHAISNEHILIQILFFKKYKECKFLYLDRCASNKSVIYVSFFNKKGLGGGGEIPCHFCWRRIPLLLTSNAVSWKFVLFVGRQKGGDLTQAYDKSPYTHGNVKRAVTTQTTPQKSSIKQRLRTDLGRSVGVTTATQLVWLTGLRAHLPTPRNSRVIKRTHI